MRIHVINPNTTRSMTLKIGAAAKAAASPGVEVTAVNPDFGPASIEGYFDEAFSVPGLIEEIGKARDADAFVIACFDDTGLEAARCATAAPVIGIGEAAFHMASLIAAKFSVVTTLSRSIIADRAQPGEIRAYRPLRPRARRRGSGAGARRAGLRTRGASSKQEIERALAEDGAEAIVLGCAGMTDLARDLERKAGVPVLDGVACAVSLAESLVRLGLKTSKRNTYAAPLAKPYAGEFKRFSPVLSDTSAKRAPERIQVGRGVFGSGELRAVSAQSQRSGLDTSHSSRFARRRYGRTITCVDLKRRTHAQSDCTRAFRRLPRR